MIFVLNLKKHLLPVFAVLLLLIQACNTNPQADKQAKKQAPAAASDEIEQLNDQVVNDPNNPDLYIQRAKAYSEKGLYQMAIDDIHRALAIDSTVSDFYAELSDIYYQKRDLAAAQTNVEKALQYDEENVEALLRLAELQFIYQNYPAAIENINKALKLDERLYRAYFLKGYVYLESGDTTLARSSFQTATEIKPDFYDAYVVLGNIAAAKGDPLAEQYFNTALQLRPGSSEALYNFGMYFQTNRQPEKALEIYAKLIQTHPDEFLGYYNTGYIYLTAYQDYETAMAYFDTVLMVQPDYVDAVYNKGLSQENLGMTREAEQSYRQALAIDPQYDLAAHGLSRLLE